MMWGCSRRCGHDVGTTGTMWRPRGQHVETMGTTCGDYRDHRPWGPSGGYGDNVGMTGMTRERCGDDVVMTGTMWGQRGPRNH